MLGPGAQKNGVIGGRQLRQRDILSHFRGAFENDTGLLEHGLEGIAVFLVQTEGRDAVTEHAAHSGICVDEGDVGPGLIEPDTSTQNTISAVSLPAIVLSPNYWLNPASAHDIVSSKPLS